MTAKTICAVVFAWLLGCEEPHVVVAHHVEAGADTDPKESVLDTCNRICDERDRIRELTLLRDELKRDIERLQRPTVGGTRYINDAGYPVTAFLLPDGGTRIVFVGPPFEGPPP